MQAADQLKLAWFPETVQSMKPTWAYVCMCIMIIRLLSHVSIGKNHCNIQPFSYFYALRDKVTSYSYYHSNCCGASSSIKIVLWLCASTLVSHCELYSEVLTYLMIMYSLGVVHGMFCMHSLSSLIKNAMY